MKASIGLDVGVDRHVEPAVVLATRPQRSSMGSMPASS